VLIREGKPKRPQIKKEVPTPREFATVHRRVCEGEPTETQRCGGEGVNAPSSPTSTARNEATERDHHRRCSALEVRTR
jgi:hypothetical protein